MNYQVFFCVIITKISMNMYWIITRFVFKLHDFDINFLPSLSIMYESRKLKKIKHKHNPFLFIGKRLPYKNSKIQFVCC